MSDRTYFQLVVYDAPAEQLAAFRAAIDPNGPEIERPDPYAEYLADLGTANESPEDGEALPLRWGWDQCQLDAATAYGALIGDVMPGATWRAWTDPVYEWRGELVMAAPDLGVYVGECDADGHAIADARELREAIDGAEDIAAVRSRIGALLGSAWDDRMRPFRETVQPDGSVLVSA